MKYLEKHARSIGTSSNLFHNECVRAELAKRLIPPPNPQSDFLMSFIERVYRNETEKSKHERVKKKIAHKCKHPCLLPNLKIQPRLFTNHSLLLHKKKSFSNCFFAFLFIVPFTVPEIFY